MKITREEYERYKPHLSRQREWIAKEFNLSERKAEALKILHENETLLQCEPDSDRAEVLVNDGYVKANAVGDRPLTREEMFNLHGINNDKMFRLFKCVKYQVRNWDTSMKVDDKPVKRTNYATAASFKLMDSGEYLQHYLKEMLEGLIVNPFNIPAVNKKGTGLLFEFSAADIHFGQWCWEAECDKEGSMDSSWDRVMTALKKSIGSAKLHGWDKAVLAITGDYLTIDDTRHGTSKGTPQDIDGTYKEIYMRGLELLINMVRTLAEYAPVRVILLPGNHDTASAFTLSCALAHIFKEYPDIEIEPCIRTMAYQRWGQVLIGYDHGKDKKHNDLPLIMDMDNKTDDIIYREIHIGHDHGKYRTQIVGNTVIRTLANIAVSDSWGHNRGYRCPYTGCEAFLYNTEGLEAQYFIRV